jgi:hypothetical protein
LERSIWYGPPERRGGAASACPAQRCLVLLRLAAQLPISARRFAGSGGAGSHFLGAKPAARWLRRLARRWVRQDACRLEIDPTQWHAYRLQWQAEQVRFWVDEALVLETAAAPRGPLGLVLWVDNQYAALPPDGRLRFGTLPNPRPAWLEIAELRCGMLG